MHAWQSDLWPPKEGTVIRSTRHLAHIVGAVIVVVSLSAKLCADESAGTLARFVNELGAPHPLTRQYAAYALGLRFERPQPDAPSPEPGSVIPALFRALDDGDAEVRRAATEALGKVGEPARNFLLAALTDENSNDRDRSRAALGLRHLEDDHVIAALTTALGLESRAHRLKGETGGADPQEASDGDWRTRIAAARTLAQCRAAHEDVVVTLATELGAPDPQCRAAALDGIATALANRTGSLVTQTYNHQPDTLDDLLHAIRSDPANGTATPTQRMRWGRSVDGYITLGPAESSFEGETSDRARHRRTVETLTRGLAAPDARIRQTCAELLAGLDAESETVTEALVVALFEGPTRPRAEMARALGQAGRRSAIAVPALLTAFVRGGDSAVAVWSAWALGEHGERAREAVPELVLAIERHAHDAVPYDADVSRMAARALGLIGPKAAAAIPALLGMVSSNCARPAEDYPFCEQLLEPAVEAMGRIGGAAIPSLVPLLDGQDVPLILRRRAARAFAAMGAEASGAGDAIVRAADDRDDGLRFAATQALASIGDPTAFSALARRLDDEAEDTRLMAEQGLRRAAARALGVLEATLASGTPDARIAAARLIAQLDDASPALPALARALADEYYEVRDAAGRTLVRHGDRALLALLTQLVAGPPLARCAAATSLGELGNAASPAIPALILALVDTEEDVGDAAASALTNIGEPATAAVLNAYRQGGCALRRRAFAVLCSQSVRAPASIPILVEVLGDTDPEVREQAVAAFARWGSGALPAIEAAFAAEEGWDDGVARRARQSAALATLGKLCDADDLRTRCQKLVLAHVGRFQREDRGFAVQLLARGIEDRTGVERDRWIEAITPALVDAMGDEYEPTASTARALLSELGRLAALIGAISHDSPIARANVARALGNFHEEAAAVAPRLVELFADQDADVVRAAQHALIGLRAPAALDALMAALHVGQTNQSIVLIIDALERYGEHAAPATKRIVEWMDHNSATTAAGARTLAAIGAPAIPALVGLVNGQALDNRVRAMETLGSMGEVAAPAVPALAAQLTHSDSRVCLGAAAALGRIGAPAVPTLIAALERREVWFRIGVLNVLKDTLIPETKAAIPAVEKLLGDPDEDVRRFADWTLRYLRER